jgi:hypothetical protein
MPQLDHLDSSVLPEPSAPEAESLHYTLPSLAAASHGLMVVTPLPSKSRVFRVTTVRSLASAVAAINESTVGSVFPVRDPWATSDAQRFAA